MKIAPVTSHTGVPAAIGFVIGSVVPFGADVLTFVGEGVELETM